MVYELPILPPLYYWIYRASLPPATAFLSCRISAFVVMQYEQIKSCSIVSCERSSSRTNLIGEQHVCGQTWKPHTYPVLCDSVTSLCNHNSSWNGSILVGRDGSCEMCTAPRCDGCGNSFFCSTLKYQTLYTATN